MFWGFFVLHVFDIFIGSSEGCVTDLESSQNSHNFLVMVTQ